MRTLYFHIAELMDKTMSEVTLINNDHPHAACQIYALKKALYAQAEILLHMTRYYKDQISDPISEETLVQLKNDMMTGIRESQESIFKDK